jgi:hypothetical protein
MIKEDESAVSLQAFAFDRRTIDSLVFALWKFARRDHGVITRSGPAGDIRLTVDFAQVITSAHLDTRIKLMKHSQ